MVRRLNIDGDGQGDLAGHGGEQRAVFVYQLDSYRHWRAALRARRLRATGMFGENFTVDGLPDDEVCIGDRYRIGEAEFEVTQPRVTCYRVGMRLGEPQLPSLLVAHHRPGFYLRVLTEGRIRPATRSSRSRPGRKRCAWPTPTRCCTCPAPTPAAARRAADPGAQPGLAGLVPRHARRPGPGGGSGRTCLAGFRQLRVTKIVHERRGGVLGLPGGRDGTALPAAAGRASTSRVRVTGAGAAGPGPHLFALVGAGRRHVPDQRQTGAARRGQRLAAHQHLEPARRWRWPRRAASSPSTTATGPVLLISAGIGVTPVLAMLHQLAAPAASVRCGGCTRRAARPSTRSPRRRTPCSPPCRTPTSTSSTARHAGRRHRAHAAPAGSPGRGSPRCASRPPRRPPISAGRPRS